MLPGYTPKFGEQFSRHELVRSPYVWYALRGTFFVLSVACLVLSFFMPDIEPWRMQVMAGLLLGMTAVLCAHQAPMPDTLWAHGLLAVLYVGPALAIWAFSPAGSATVASGMFIGPLVAMWTTKRSHQIAHLAAATFVLFTPSLLGFTNTGTVVSVVAMVLAVWALSGCVSVVLEGSERQGVRLGFLMRRDPLTGIGNRRLLDERLADLAGPESTHHRFAVLTLDLDGFKAINDTLGHAAGDDLLRAVARALRTVAPSEATLVRQGGDEFAVLLPGASQQTAEGVGLQIAAALNAIPAAGRLGEISSGIGTAAFPVDGRSPAALLDLADERLRTRKAARAAALAAGAVPTVAYPEPEQHTAPPVEDLFADAMPDQGDESDLLRYANLEDGLGRRDMEKNTFVWTANYAMYLIYAVLGLVMWLLVPELTTPGFLWVIAFAALVGIVYRVQGPPAIGTRSNHVVVAMAYVVPTVLLVTCQPGGTMAIGCSIFIGPLTATRFTSRAMIAAHLAFASFLLLALIPSGLIDAPSIVAVLILLIVMWILGVCCTLVLEAAEMQTIQLRELVGVDPLTGAGNRRSLEHFLERELRHVSTKRPLSLLAFDFNGFKALNDTVGHAAGDALLVAAATALRTTATEGEHVFRQGGDEFLVIRVGGPVDENEARVAAYRGALATVDCNGSPLTTGVGIASSPIDGFEASELLGAADIRLLADKRLSPHPASRESLGHERLSAPADRGRH